MIERVEFELKDGKIEYKDPAFNLGVKMTHATRLEIIEKALYYYLSQVDKKNHGINRTSIIIMELLEEIKKYRRLNDEVFITGREKC